MALAENKSPSYIPTRDEITQLARDLIPELKERAQETEDIRKMPEANMQPLLDRTKNMIDKTGNKELALVMIFERTGCFFQMCLDAKIEPGKRTFTFPFKKVLDAATRLGQFDMTEKELLDNWWRPRYAGYGEAVGVKFNISDMDENGKVTVTLAD